MQNLEAFYRAIQCFNEGDYYECHEILEEDCWRPESDPYKAKALQAMIQQSVAFVHLERGNLNGFERLLNKAELNLVESIKESSVNLPVDLINIYQDVQCWKKLF